MIVAVTGHRPNKLGGEYDMKGPLSTSIYNALKEEIEKLDPEKMISGMALGVDMIFANLAVRLHRTLIAAVPFSGQELKWPPQSQKIYNTLLSYADEIVIVSPGGYSPAKMQKRNEWMVDNCDVLIAVWDGSPGGTANCRDYARSVGKRIINIDPLFLA
jgi:uncharacterized phage-like protein YoqJ